MFKLSNHFKYESILMITFNPNHVALKHLSEMCLFNWAAHYKLTMFSFCCCLAVCIVLVQVIQFCRYWL